MSKPSKWRTFKAVVLNMPDDEIPGIKERLQGKNKPQKPASAPAAEQAPQTDSWESLLEPAATSPAAGEGESEENLWQAVTPAATASPWKKLVRWSAIGLILLFCWIGFRAAVFGFDTETTVDIPLEATYPSQAAEAVAEGFAPAYLTFKEGEDAARAQAMAPYYSGGLAEAKLGWDGKGHQEASNARVIKVTPIDSQRSRVTVQANVTSFNAEGNPESTKPVALELSVIVTDEGAAVYGTPAYVGIAEPPQVTATEEVNQDSALASETRADIDAFFEAYASQTNISSITAPGSTITGLGGIVSEPTVTSWKVEGGESDTRKGWAVVEYKANGAKLTQFYQVKLVKVSGGSSAKWQILEIEGSES